MYSIRKPHAALNKYVRKSLKVILWVLGSIILLVGLILLLIQLPFVQQIAKKKVVSFLESKVSTRVEIDRLTFDFPKIVVLEGVYFEDQAGDTLLAGDTLKVDISLLKLLSNQVMINEVDLRGITSHIKRTVPDSTFNFEYFINAFVKEEKKDVRYDSATAMKFSVSKINLERIRLKMKDDVFGNDLNVYLRHFDTDIEKFDLDNRTFNIPKINLNGVYAQLHQTKALNREVSTVDTINITPSFNYPDIRIKELDISDIHLDYKNAISAINSSLDLGSLFIAVNDLDLKNQLIDVSHVKLEDTQGYFGLGESAKAAAKATATEVATVLEKGWAIKLDKLDLQEIDFGYEDLNEKEIARGIDYNYLNVKDIMADAGDIYYQADSLTARINQLSFTESSGLELQKFEADIAYGSHGASLENFMLKTPRSTISERIVISYPSLDSISKDIGSIGFSANFNQSEIAVRDLLLVAPALRSRDIFRRNPDNIILLEGNIDGRLNDLEFRGLSVSGLGNVVLRGSGEIRGLPDMNTVYADLDIDHLSATSRDIRGLIPAGSIPTSIEIPESIALQGTFKGRLQDFSINTRIRSSFGSAAINGTFKNITNRGRESYNARINTTAFNLGRLIKQEDKLGEVTMNINLKGSGIDPKTANAIIAGDVDEFHYNGYTYRNINLDVTANNGDIEVDGSIRDPNASLAIDANAKMAGEYPAVQATLQIDSINLQPLNFYEKDLRFRGIVIADLPTADPDYLNGTIEVSDMVLALEGERYRLDTLSLESVATPGDDSLSVKAEFLTVDLQGQYQLTQLIPALQGTISKYIDLNATGTPKPFEPQDITFSATVMRSPLVAELFPELEEMQDATLAGNFNSTTGEIKIEGSFPQFRYKAYTVSNMDLDIHTEADALQYAVTLDQINSEQFRIVNTSITGQAKDDVLDVNLLIKDLAERDHYRIAGKLTTANKTYEFKLLPDGLLLNYDPWAVSPGNALQFGNDGLMARDFTISNAGQSLRINSVPQQPDATLEVTFESFQIETLTSMVTRDSLYAGGEINGTANLRQLKTNPVFTADLIIDDFSFQGDTLGQVAMKVNNEKANTYAAEVAITGDGNEVNITGKYYDTGEESRYDLDIDIVSLQVKSIEGFTMGQIEDGTGSLDGELKLTGTMKQPEIRGRLHFDETGFTVIKFNSFFRVQDETINFTPEGIVLNDFILLDSAGNRAIFDGNIFTTDYRNFRFGMSMVADDFQVLNSTRRDNKLFFGRLFVDARATIGGGFENPIVEGNVRINEKTAITVVVPQKDPGIVEREGIVEFIDADTLEMTFLNSPIDTFMETGVTGIDVVVQITVDREASLSLVLDEANGDYLNIKGAANLTGGIDPSGKISLTGQYEIDEGAYSFSFNQLKREFSIERGSSINWTGEPMMAELNVTAIYTVEAAPLSLVQDQLGETDQSVINTYKQKIPFQILLTMRGQLLRPEIAFDIFLPEGHYNVSSEVIANVQTRLTQLRTEPSELNKQVFAALLLNRFISDDPFQNEARSAGISSLARQSASRLLSEQLNNLVGGMVAGFDLNFDINSIEDYTTGELQNRTDLTVGLSKRMLDDRLNISIGSNFELEGPQETDRKSTNIAGDIEVEYQLTKDGRYLVRAYRHDEYIVVQGQVVETGIGFVFTADYEKFKDLFAKRTEEQKVLRRVEKDARRQERIDNE